MPPLHGKIALITGGSRGIGLAIAQHFARLGASTILVGRNAETLRAAAHSVRDQPVAPLESSRTASQVDSQSSCSPPPPPPQPAFHHGVEGDVSRPETWDDLTAKLSKGHFGPTRVDVLVNCAGVSQASLLARTTLEDIEKILDINLKSAVLGCKFIGRQMMRGVKLSGRGEGWGGDGPSIINVSSVMAMRGGTGAAVYAATKAGLLGLTSALSTELGQYGIRVNALVPGYIETDMIQNFSRSSLSEHIPLRRLGRVEEVADAAAFLARNPYANNCVLTIDGGLTAAMS